MSRRYEIPRDVKLIGGVAATLTNTEQNEWHSFVRETAEWKDFKEQESLLNALSAAVLGGAIQREEELRAALAKAEGMVDAFHPIASKWYADLTAKDEKPDPAAVD
jgi:hypothetical protein